MKRHPTLIPLSHQHHHTLAWCLRVERQPEHTDPAAWQAHRAELPAHFAEEEALFAPWWDKLARDDWRKRFEQEHAHILDLLAQACLPAQQTALAQALRAHIRFEERELFPAMQAFLPQQENA